MPYTRRQQHVLTAIGIVPWVQREVDRPEKESTRTRQPSSSGSELTFAARPLCALANGYLIGHEAAPLLVFVESNEARLTAPLLGNAAQLFEQMMRAIDVTRGSVCQCAVLAGSEVAAAGQKTVSALVSDDHAVGIYLTFDLEDNEDASVHSFKLQIEGRNALPMWRVPHPELLLSHPLRKRQAWQALKAVRRILLP